MCLILFSYRQLPQYPLVLIANRDEFYQRPAQPLAFWEDNPNILAGRDLQQKGTWMGITRNRRIAMLTNYRDLQPPPENALSRGWLVRDYLACDDSPQSYLQRIEANHELYAGFNLLAGDAQSLWYYSNRGGAPTEIQPGLYGLSNHLLNTPWPKVTFGKQQLHQLLHNHFSPPVDQLFDLLTQRPVVNDADLPQTGVGLELERLLSPLFITSPTYGTRCSTILIQEASGKISMGERTWNSNQHQWEDVIWFDQLG